MLRVLLLFFFAAMNIDIIALLVSENPRIMTKLAHSYLPSINTTIVSSLLLRCVSVVYFLAFLSALPQIAGLCGDGDKKEEESFALIPISNSLRPFKSFAKGKPGGKFKVKGVRWLMQELRKFLSDRTYISAVTVKASLYLVDIMSLTRVCQLGIVVSSVCIIVPISLGFVYIYLAYYILKLSMGPFFNLQWDALILEAGVLSVLLAASTTNTLKLMLLSLFQLLLFRLMFGSGVVKYYAADSSWRDLTAMQYHFLTQPLPASIAKTFHQLHPVVLKFFTFSALLHELPIPILSIFPYFRPFVFILYALFQMNIMMTGRFGFFNLLSMVLGISLLRDNHIQIITTEYMYGMLQTFTSFPFANIYVFFMNTIIPRKYRTLYAIIVEAGETVVDVTVALLSMFVLLSSLVAVKNLCNRMKSKEGTSISTTLGSPKLESSKQASEREERSKAALFSYAESVHSSLSTMYIGCHYGLFANMTKHRDEVIVEVNFDGENVNNDDKWIQVDFKYKPGSELKGSIKNQTFPLFHMPRYLRL